MAPRCTLNYKCCLLLGHYDKCVEINHECDFSRIPESLDTNRLDAALAHAIKRQERERLQAIKKQNSKKRVHSDSDSDGYSGSDSEDDEDDYSDDISGRPMYNKPAWEVSVEFMTPSFVPVLCSVVRSMGSIQTLSFH